MQKKKSVFRKRGFAIVFCLALIISSTALSVNRSLGARCLSVTNTFYDGVAIANTKLRKPSIDAQLKLRAQAAAGLVTVLAAYDELKDGAVELRVAINGIYAAETVAEKFITDSKLSAAFYRSAAELEEMLQLYSRSVDREEQMLSAYRDDFMAAGKLIESSGYNDGVRKFRRETLNVFPAKFLTWAVYAKLPALYE